MNNRKIRTLDDVFSDPDAKNLLVVQHAKKITSYDPDIEHFKEIQQWVKQHDGKEPEKTSDLSRMEERRMSSRLKGFRSNKDKIELLKPYDDLGLLKTEDKHIKLEKQVQQEKHDFSSLDDVLGDDSVLFGDDSKKTVNSKLFDTHKLNEIKKEQENIPKNKSKRKRMNDFEKYRALFRAVQADIASGKRQTRPYKSNKIELHHFYVLNGQLLYIESIGSEFTNDNKSSSDRDARVHVVYDNGTENYPLRNGLIASLYGSKKRHGYGRTVTEPMDNFKLSSDDQVTGYIYVLKSESTNPEVLKVRKEHSLYKVGYTSNSVEKRIANAENESTYLYGPVRVCEEFQVTNLDSEALETAIHHALANYQLEIDIKAPNGRMIHPREWFTADLTVINEVVNEIVSKLKLLE